jgi:hypothetical protein
MPMMGKLGATKRMTTESFNLTLGDIYVLRAKNVTELIPRCKISYVSSRYSSYPVLLLFGGLALIAGLARIYGGGFGSDEARIGAVFGVVGVALIVGYFLSRRIGIVVASSGGKLFLQIRGKRRNALLDEIHADLAANGMLVEGPAILPREVA